MAEKFNWPELSTIAYKAYQSGDFTTCERLFQSAYKKLKKCGKPDVNLGYACMMLGSCHFHNQKYETAISYFKTAADIYQFFRDSRQVWNLHWLGRCLSRLNRWREASATFSDTIRVYREIKCNDKSQLLDILADAGMSLWYQGKFTKAESALRRGIILSKSDSVPLSRFNFICHTVFQLALEQQKQEGTYTQLLCLAKRSYEIFERKRTQTSAPESRTVVHTDDYFGTTIQDPYRWLESISSIDVQEWLQQQNLYSEELLASIPGRALLHQRQWNLFVPPPFMPHRYGKYYFFTHKPSGRRRSLFYRTAKLGYYPTIVLDENALSENSQVIGYWPSSDGRYLAYAISKDGSEWVTLYIKDLEKNRYVKEQLQKLSWVHICWKDDSSGFYYSAILESDSQAHERVFFHKLNSSPAEDPIIYQSESPEVTFNIRIAFGGTQMLISSRSGSDLHSLKIKSLEKLNSPAKIILFEQEHKFSYVGRQRNRLFFITDKDAPRRKLVSLKVGSKVGKKVHFEEALGQKRNLLLDVRLTTNFILGIFWTESGLVIRRYTYEGKLLSGPEFPKYTAITCRKADDEEMFLRVQGYALPDCVFRYEPTRDKLSLFASRSNNFDSSQYQTELHHARSKDGTSIPVYLSYRKGMKLNGNNPTILTAYGGFDKCTQPDYSSDNILWMDLGGIFAEAIVRGGMEFGSQWRRSGMLRRKQNTFDDFIAAAEYLIKGRFTKPAKLGISGTSNGGLLVAAVLTQRPDLFGAVVIRSGLLDMLRYHKFDLARHYRSEYGCSTNRTEFQTLYSYSPLHRVKQAEYPPVLIIAGANDDRVTPAHSYKFAAALQSCQIGSAPVLLKVEKSTGHSGHYNSNTSLDELCFLSYFLGVLPEELLKASQKLSG
jgi:prolyl oligopeptidase